MLIYGERAGMKDYDRGSVFFFFDRSDHGS